jgi:hypothetical protein
MSRQPCHSRRSEVQINMNETPGKTKSFWQRLRSLPLKAWVVILVVESFLFLVLMVILVLIVFRG